LLSLFVEDRRIALKLADRRKRRERAFKLALLFPGLGHFYAGRKLSGAFFLFLFLGPFYYLWLIGEVFSYGGIALFLSQILLYYLQAVDVKRGVHRELSPCEEACPAKVLIPTFMSLCEEGKFREAYGAFMVRAPFPFTLGQVCKAPCQLKCGVLPGRPLRIGEVHREFGRVVLKDIEVKKREPFFERVDRSVAVVGAGVAGITVAYYLASCGVEVSLYEKEDGVGGTLNYVPDFKLEKELFLKEAELALSFENIRLFLGREVRNRSEIDCEVLIAAVGSQREKRLGVEGEGIVYPLEFLSSPPALEGRSVVIVGAGDTAFDVARSAVRLGGRALLFYRGKFENIRASSEEVSLAVREGVQIFAECELVGVEGKVAVFKCSGREVKVEFDYLVPAIGFEVDRKLLSSLEPDFVVGDAATGMESAVRAVGSARLVAYEVLKKLSLGDRAWFMEDYYRPKPSRVSGSNLFVVSESSLCQHCSLKVRS